MSKGRRMKRRMKSLECAEVGERINPWGQEIGAFIPNALLGFRELSSTAKLVYGKLRQHAGKNGFCWPTQRTLADEIGVDERNVRRAIARLVKHKFIEVDYPMGRDRLDHRPSYYYFLQHELLLSEPLRQKERKAKRQEEVERQYQERMKAMDAYYERRKQGYRTQREIREDRRYLKWKDPWKSEGNGDKKRPNVEIIQI